MEGFNFDENLNKSPNSEETVNPVDKIPEEIIEAVKEAERNESNNAPGNLSEEQEEKLREALSGISGIIKE